ncbi:YncE family protein [Sphingopyxis sp. KK2]|uniref:YncE family protein n=1 Tax=Sphingopyxis sp. KK2 TaxID=1855727 RepID=UPI00097E5657|nr:hypothetical protein [Sphingopyxis sp. KK2]
MKNAILVAATALAATGPATAQQADPALPYVMADSVTLPSGDTGWDYVKFEPGGARLFMGRLKDGLTVYDVDQGKAVTTVENSVGANGPVLLPKYGRGYVAMDDGSLLSFDLKTLKVIARTRLADDGGLNSGSLDPATGQLHMITGTRPKEATWFSIDAATGKLLRTTRFPFRKMDDPAADGKGHLYAPARLDGLVLKLDSTTLKEQARWDVGCNVSKMKYLAATNRLLGACTGDRPAVFLMDPADGRILSRVTIGKGLDALAYDEERERIVSSNYEGSMSVVRREGDTLTLVATVRTSFGARMMDIDHRTGRLYLVNADSTDLPAKDGGEEVTVYHPDSFRVETWQPN